MKFDLHTHHFRCGHADGNIRDYIEAGIQAGLQVIGISDHSPFYASPEDHAVPNITMAKSELANYVEEVLKLKQEYEGKIDVLLGIEADFIPAFFNDYNQALSKHPFDYIIGSVHHVEEVSIFNKNRWKNLSKKQKQAVKEEYYRLIQLSAKSGLYQILGHIDAMKGNYPPFSDIETPHMLDQTLEVIAASDVAIEINTSGKTKLSGGWYPSDEILERALHYGVQVTFGSDAHIPQRVGDEWEQVSKRLIEIGFTEWVYYKEKQKKIVALV